MVIVAGMLSMPAAADPPGASFQHRVSPAIQKWLLAPQRRAELRPGSAAPISVRFRAAPSHQTLRRHNRAGVTFVPGGGDERPLHLGTIYPARATRRGLAALGRCPQVLRVELDSAHGKHPALDSTAKEVDAVDTWPKMVNGVPLTGKGMVIGLFDSGVDPHHPFLFRADGPLVAWLDVNNNGVFDVGTDAADVNGNGKADKGETLRLVDSAVWDDNCKKSLPGSANGKYEPDREWLYADKNGNKKRDYGVKAGFDDKTPALGEPLYVADDLDRDGKLDPEEKLVALQTSKVKGLTRDGKEYSRGKDLTEVPIASMDLQHGQATSGILVGGQRGHSRWVGIVPDADLLMGAVPSDYKNTWSSVAVWLFKAKADVMLHEYNSWTEVHMDGSSNYESLMDQAAKLGVPQVALAGNLGGGARHMTVIAASDAVREVPLYVPAPSSKVLYYVNWTFLWRDTSAKLQFSLKDPKGKVVSMPYSSSDWTAWGDGLTRYWSYREDSSRGTAMMDITVTAWGNGKANQLAPGTWTVLVKNPGTNSKVSLLGYVSDNMGWWGSYFDDFVSEKHIISWPGTADSAITVAAYAGHVGKPFENPPTKNKSGELRLYSGRGRRIDGKAILDIAAPDNPITSLHEAGKFGHGAFQVFGGTSGAGPHVAGAALLLKQHDPGLDGLAVRKALRAGALADTQVGTVPSDKWGYGKLRIYQSIYGKAPTPNKAPTARILVSAKKVYAGMTVTLTPEVKDETPDEYLKIRWDDGYDGKYDSSYGPIKARKIKLAKVGKVRIKLLVKDLFDLTGGAAVLLNVLPASQRPDAGADGGEGDDDDNGCGCGIGGTAPVLPLLICLLVLLSRRRMW